MVVVDAHGSVVYANRAAGTQLGQVATQLVGAPLGLPLDDGEQRDLDVVGADGQPGVAVMRVTACCWGGEAARLCVISDRTQERSAQVTLRRLQERLDELQTHDPMTGLLNRAGLEQALRRECERSDRGAAPIVALLADVDRFKQLRDRHGQATADRLLVGIAQRLQAAVRRSDYVGWLGGDGYLVLLTETRLSEGLHVAEKLREAVQNEALRDVAGRPIAFTISMGLAALGSGVESLEDALATVQEALRRSKQEGRGSITSGQAAVSTEDVMSGVLSALCDPDTYTVMRQPIVRLQDKHVVGYEFLSRGRHGPYELPADFLKLAGDRDVLAHVDLACLQACLRSASRAGADVMHFNLFPVTVQTFADRVAEAVTGAKIKNVCVELSERMFFCEPTTLVEGLRTLRSAGIRVAIDNVGFGRSALESVVVLEPDAIKIDRSRIHGVHRSPAKQNVLRRLVVVGHSLGSSLIAEGVELDADADWVKQAGMECGQGYIWGRPA